MPTLPAVIVTLLLPFEHLFDPRTWRKAQLLAMGGILSPGKRTVSSALNILGIGQHGDFAVYHHVLNRARWSPLQLSRALLLPVAGRFGSSTEPLVFGIDETVERRWGRKIAAKGRYRDPVRSKDDQVVMTPELQWVSLMLLTRIGWAGRHWALPFLTALVVSCPASTIFAGWRQSVLPVHLLGLAPLLGSVGPVAGDVKLQDDGVVHDPVNRRGGGHGVGKDALPLREDQV